MPSRSKITALRTEPLWVRVDRNRAKLAVFVGLFVVGSAVLLGVALVAVPGSLIGLVMESPGYYADLLRWVLAAILTLLALGALIAAVQLANAEDWVRNRFKGTDLDLAAHPGLVRALGDMSIAAGLAEPPSLIVFDVDSVNACAIGTNRKRPTIGVTRGFLSELAEAEQRAVIATLVARIIAGDILFGTALAALMGPLKLIRNAKNGAGAAVEACGCAAADGCSPLDGCSGADGCSDGCLFDSLDGDDASGCLGAIGIALFIAVVIAITWIAVTLAAFIVTAWGRALHRTSYEKADAEGMLLLKDPGAMLTALAKTIARDNLVAEGDPSYDGIFYASTSGTPRVEKVERRRYDRLREVLGTDGLAAGLAGNAEAGQQPPAGE
jgi:Zn-dependent protease with chaperone function